MFSRMFSIIIIPLLVALFAGSTGMYLDEYYSHPREYISQEVPIAVFVVTSEEHAEDSKEPDIAKRPPAGVTSNGIGYAVRVEQGRELEVIAKMFDDILRMRAFIEELIAEVKHLRGMLSA